MDSKVALPHNPQLELDQSRRDDSILRVVSTSTTLTIFFNSGCSSSGQYAMVPISSRDRMIPSVHNSPTAKSKSSPGVLIVTDRLSPLTRISSGSSITTSSSTRCDCVSSTFTTDTRLESRMDVHYTQAALPLTYKGDAVMSNAAKSDLKVGQKAPDFTVLNDKGEKVKLSDFKGKKVVLYFYPKDDTPGCTKEACAFRDGIAEIKKQGGEVIGVSVDSIDSHKKFKNKFDLNFPLLADTDKKMVEAYGTWKEKSMYGRKYMGTERTTFIIDEQGKISHIFPKVKVVEHYDEVLAALKE